MSSLGSLFRRRPDKNPSKNEDTREKMHDGKHYRNQAMALIWGCQHYSTIRDSTQYIALFEVIEKCDKAILSAYKVRWGRDRGTEADQEFQEAKRSLEDYVRSYHGEDELKTVGSRIQRGKSMDEANVRRWWSVFRKAQRLEQKSINFVILGQFSGEVSIKLTEMLYVDPNDSDPNNSMPQQILWNFGHPQSKKRVILAQNPHFYASDKLPENLGAYKSDKTIPTVSEYSGTICVVTSHPDVFVEIGLVSKGEENPGPRGWVFDNVWLTNNTLLFRSFEDGQLFGEISLKNDPKSLVCHHWHVLWRGNNAIREPYKFHDWDKLFEWWRAQASAHRSG